VKAPENGHRPPAATADPADAERREVPADPDAPRQAAAAEGTPRGPAADAQRQAAAADARLRAAAADAELRAAATDAGLRAAAADAELRSAAAGQRPEGEGAAAARPPCCPLYHEAIELIGRRWTGAIVSVLIHHTTLRFGEIADSVPELSDRLLSERMKELEARGVVVRTVRPGRPVRVEYELTAMGRELEPAVRELETWARRWLAQR
jgi:DNA-binding HxlR family transcriptional regulator